MGYEDWAPNNDVRHSGPTIQPGAHVKHTHQLHWEDAPRTRHGIVAAIGEPADVGDGQTRTYAEVHWSNGDGVTNTPVDELDPIG